MVSSPLVYHRKRVNHNRIEKVLVTDRAVCGMVSLFAFEP